MPKILKKLLGFSWFLLFYLIFVNSLFALEQKSNHDNRAINPKKYDDVLPHSLVKTADITSLNLPQDLQAIYSDKKDRFYANFGKELHRITTQVDRIFTFNSPVKGFTATNFQNGVGPDGTVFSMMDSSRMVCLDKECTHYTTYYRIDLLTCSENATCHSKPIANWRIQKNQKYHTKFSALLKMGEQGTPFYVLTKTDIEKHADKISTSYFCHLQICSEEEMNRAYYSEMPAQPKSFIHHSGVGFRINGRDEQVKNIVFYGN